MSIYYSQHSSVNNPPIVRNFNTGIPMGPLIITNDIPVAEFDGVNLEIGEDAPLLNPGRGASLNFGADYTDVIAQASFISRRGKNRGAYGMAFLDSASVTLGLVLVLSQGKYTKLTLFSDTPGIREIQIFNFTEDSVSAAFGAGQGTLEVAPSIPVVVTGGGGGPVVVTNFKDLVNEIILNNNQANNDNGRVGYNVQRMVGPNVTP